VLEYQNKGDKNNNNNNKPYGLAASSTSSLATIDMDADQKQIVEEENIIMNVMKTGVIPLVLGILFAVLFNYFFIHEKIKK